MKVITSSGELKKISIPPTVETSFVGCRLTKSGTQTLTNNIWAIITFNVEDFDTHNFHSNVTNTSRITIPTGYDGYYLINYHVDYESNSTNARFTAVALNSGGTPANGVLAYVSTSASTIVALTNTLIYELSAGDYIEVHAFQSSGGNLNVNSSTLTNFSCRYLGP